MTSMVSLKYTSQPQTKRIWLAYIGNIDIFVFNGVVEWCVAQKIYVIYKGFVSDQEFDHFLVVILHCKVKGCSFQLIKLIDQVFVLFKQLSRLPYLILLYCCEKLLALKKLKLFNRKERYELVCCNFVPCLVQFLQNMQ